MTKKKVLSQSTNTKGQEEQSYMSNNTRMQKYQGLLMRDKVSQTSNELKELFLYTERLNVCEITGEIRENPGELERL